jgi:hypothetical protein
MKTEKEIFEELKKRSYPDGKTDKGHRWYPSAFEECDCCKSIRKPSRAWGFSLYNHCKTKKHLKNLASKIFHNQK